MTTLGLALLATMATIIVMYACMLALVAGAYALDNWQYLADTFKFVGRILLVYVVWVAIIGTYKLTHTTTNSAEVEINLTETLQ